MSQIRIGISGWTYTPWRGVFYPSGLQHRRELEYASRQFNSIEINGSFYSLQTPSSYRRWYEETPDDFVFSVKGGRFITHMKKLLDPEQSLANFFASGVLRLAEKLGPILWQFPATFRYDHQRFSHFLRVLPKDTGEAAAIARTHDHRLEGRSWTESPADVPLRHAFEIRHPSCLSEEFVALLRGHGAALVLADTAGLWPYAEDVTADFMYLRLHGAETLYTSGYTDEQLDWWAARIRAWSAGAEPADATLAAPGTKHARGERDVYVYFDNDAKVHAPADAKRLAQRLA